MINMSSRGCHEAIVTPEEWEQVQDIIDRRPTIMKGNACPFYNLFHGLVYCATCGKSMQVRYEKVGRTGKNRFTGEMREPIDRAYYICQTYNRLGKNACTSHKIEARDLYNLVLKDISGIGGAGHEGRRCVLPAAQQPDGAPVSGGRFPDREGTETAGRPESGN